MPTEWTYHADGVNTAVSTAHDLDGTLERVTIELDTFRVREWEPENGPTDGKDINGEKIPEHTDWNEEKRVYEEYGDGAHATLRFGVEDGIARLSSIEPEDGDRAEPRHMRLLPAADRVVQQLETLEQVENPIDALYDAYDDAYGAGIHIDALDQAD